MSRNPSFHVSMKCFGTLLILLLRAVHVASGAQMPPSDEPIPTVKLEPVTEEAKNRIGMSYLMGMNITVDFKRLGGLGLSNPGPATGGAVNRTYDNGYNRVDVSTNAGGQTWYWGYQNPRAVQGDNLSLQSYSTPDNINSNNHRDDPQSGVEVFYQRELLRGKNWRFGANAAFGYMYVSINDTRPIKATSYRTNDTFALGGIIPPLAPYNGTFEGPGPLIGSAPLSRTTDVLAKTATITGERTVESDVFTVRLGPYLELPVYKRLSLMLEGGLTLAVADTTTRFSGHVTISDPSNSISLTSRNVSVSNSETDFLVGAYAGGAIECELTKQVTLIVGAHYQTSGQAINHLGKKESILDFGNSAILSVGAIYSF